MENMIIEKLKADQESMLKASNYTDANKIMEHVTMLIRTCQFEEKSKKYYYQQIEKYNLVAMAFQETLPVGKLMTEQSFPTIKDALVNLIMTVIEEEEIANDKANNFK